jgi:hypothetical protein
MGLDYIHQLVKVVYKEIPPHISIVWVNEEILMLKYVVDIITTLLSEGLTTPFQQCRP